MDARCLDTADTAALEYYAEFVELSSDIKKSKWTGVVELATALLGVGSDTKDLCEAASDGTLELSGTGSLRSSGSLVVVLAFLDAVLSTVDFSVRGDRFTYSTVRDPIASTLVFYRQNRFSYKYIFLVKKMFSTSVFFNIKLLLVQGALRPAPAESP